MQSLLATKRNLIDVIGSVPGAVVKKDHPCTSHDTVFLHGTLKPDAVMSMMMRGGPGFKGSPALDWPIHGETSEPR